MHNSETGQSIVYIIVNAIDPYGYEINQFLARPDGMSNVVRFKSKWLPTIHDTNQIKDRDGVLILRDWETAKFIPLRRIKIISVLQVGDIYDIEWIGKEFINYGSKNKIRKKQLKRFNKHILNLLSKYKNEPKKDLMNLVFTVNADYSAEINDAPLVFSESEPELHRWGKVIDAIGRLDYFIDVDFLKVIGIDMGSEKFQPLITTDSLGSKRYKLHVDESYRLVVYQRAYTDKGRGDSSVSPRTMVLKSDSKLVRIIDDHKQISGKYAGYRFLFKTQTLRRQADTDIRIEINRQDGRSMPEIYIPIRIETPLWRFLLRVASVPVFVAGTIGLFLADQLFPNDTWLAASFGILLMILTGGETRDLVYQALSRLSIYFSDE